MEIMRVLGSASIHGRGRIQIPKKVRELLKIKDGDMVYFTVEENKIVVRKSQESKLI